MKLVAIDSSDGHTFMYDPLEYYATPPDMEWMVKNTIEVPDHIWEEWKEHCDEVRKWGKICNDLGNKIYERKYG